MREEKVEAPYLFTQLDSLLGAEWVNYNDYNSGTTAVVDTLNQLAQVVSLSAFIGGLLICLLMIPGTYVGVARANRLWNGGVAFGGLAVLLGLPIAVSWYTKDWAVGFLCASMLVLVGVMVVGATRSIKQSAGAGRWHYVVAVLFLATAGGLTGNLTGWNRTGLVSEIAPILFSTAVGAVAYLLTSQFSRASRAQPSSFPVMSDHGMKFLAAGAAAFVTSFFFLFHSADRQSSQMQRFDACLEIYLEPSFYSDGQSLHPSLERYSASYVLMSFAADSM